MATPHLAQIAYASALCAEPQRGELDRLLSGWRRRNAQRGITGLVLHHAGSIFQVLEGFPDEVPALYEAIARDPRHRFVARLVAQPTSQRSFGDWSMGLGRVTGRELAVVPALRVFADPGFCYWHCDELMAEALVAAFTTGPWRRSII